MKYEDWHELRHSPDELHNNKNNIDPRDIINPNGPEIILGIYNAITNEELTRFYIKAYDKEGAFYILRHSRYAWVYDDEDLLVKYIGTTDDQPKNSVNENKYDFDVIDYEDDEQDILDHQTISKTVYKYFPKNSIQLKRLVRSRINENPYKPYLLDICTSEINSMSELFNYLGAVEELDLHTWDTSNVTDMSNMFGGCCSLKRVNLQSFDTSNVTNMQNMFNECVSLEYLNLQSFDISNVTNISSMFYNCKSLKELNLSNFDTSSVTDMSFLFTDCNSLKKLDLSGFNTANVEDMHSMFNGCYLLEELDLSDWNVSNVLNMGYMFTGCNTLKKLDLSSFDTSSIKYMSHIFSSCKKLKELDLSNFNTSGITDMSYIFCNCYSLQKLNLSGWDTTNVTSMDNMFSECTSLTQLDLSSFSTPSINYIGYMFNNCISLISLDLSNFEITNSTNMELMFTGCKSLKNVYTKDKHINHEFNMFRKLYDLYVNEGLETAEYNFDIINYGEDGENIIDINDIDHVIMTPKNNDDEEKIFVKTYASKKSVDTAEEFKDRLNIILKPLFNIKIKNIKKLIAVNRNYHNECCFWMGGYFSIESKFIEGWIDETFEYASINFLYTKDNTFELNVDIDHLSKMIEFCNLYDNPLAFKFIGFGDDYFVKFQKSLESTEIIDNDYGVIWVTTGAWAEEPKNCTNALFNDIYTVCQKYVEFILKYLKIKRYI